MIQFSCNFILLFIGQTISQLGSSMTSFALIIWAYSTSGRVMASSLLAVCSALPYLMASLLGGAVADNISKKKIMLVCDLTAALGTVVILICYSMGSLQLWILCLVNGISGFMNAFQNPASQVAVTLLINPKDYGRIGGFQSAVSGIADILKPVLAAALLSIGGLKIILLIDLCTFAFAFITLLFFVEIPEKIDHKQHTSISVLLHSLAEGIHFIKKEQALLVLLIMYSVLEFMGAVSFDSMYTPLILARTGNNQQAVGVVSAFMAAGCLTASIMLSVKKSRQRRLRWMYLGSYICLTGITLFGMGRNMAWWCAVAFFGCFGAPVYQIYQTVIIREKVDVAMQGRIFSLQGMITGMLAPLGYFTGAMLADYIFVPFMNENGSIQNILYALVGEGNGSGIGLIFVIAGISGIIILTILRRNKMIRGLDP